MKQYLELFSLGELYPSDFLQSSEQPRSTPVEMKLMMDRDSRAVRLEKTAAPEHMYGRYWYRSGINQSMRDELRGIVESITKVKKLQDGDVWLDIACNDGTLLSHVPDNLFRIGIDPVDDSFKQEAELHANVIVQDYFSFSAYKKASLTRKSSVVTCIAMFYDLDDPRPFLADVYDVMDDDGLFVLQMSYTPLMLEQLAFDNICHEHIYYYTLATIGELLSKAGFRLMDVQLNDVNGGSFRIYAMKRTANLDTFGTQPYRDVCNMRVQSMITHELDSRYNTPEVWLDFYDKIQKLKEQTVSFIQKVRSEGKTVWGYGASTKGNTLLQYFGLDHTMIDAIAERSPYKFGLRTVGTNIPIVSEEEMRAAKPDYMLVLPWHFRAEFLQREQEYIQGGGHFIFPCPVFDVV